MKPRYKTAEDYQAAREKLLNAGLVTMRKSYYPALQAQLRDLREKEKYLEEKSQALLKMVEDLKSARAEIEKLNEELEQRVALRTQELQTANKELEAFTYMVSHDLRAPLRHISGFCELLKDAVETPDERTQGFMRNIQGGVTRMNELISKLLEFSRAGRSPIRHKAVDLNMLVEDARKELRDDCESRQIAWSVHTLPVVWADESLLYQVISNLISNALKYSSTKPESQIEIGSQEKENEFVVSVRDNGVGFDVADAERLFQPFQRLHSGR